MRECIIVCALPDIVILKTKAQAQIITFSKNPRVHLLGGALIPCPPAPSLLDVTAEELCVQQLCLPFIHS